MQQGLCRRVAVYHRHVSEGLLGLSSGPAWHPESQPLLTALQLLGAEPSLRAFFSSLPDESSSQKEWSLCAQAPGFDSGSAIYNLDLWKCYPTWLASTVKGDEKKVSSWKILLILQTSLKYHFPSQPCVQILELIIPLLCLPKHATQISARVLSTGVVASSFAILFSRQLERALEWQK